MDVGIAVGESLPITSAKRALQTIFYRYPQVDCLKLTTFPAGN
jgi:hypothetical protein